MRVPSYLAVAMLLVGGTASDNSTDSCPAPWEPGPWGAALEEWALTAPVHSGRQGRVMSLPPAPGYYITDRVDRPPPPPQLMGPPALGPQGPQPYDEWNPPPSEKGKIVNQLGNGGPYKEKPFKPSPAYPAQNQNQLPSIQPPAYQSQQQAPPHYHNPPSPQYNPPPAQYNPPPAQYNPPPSQYNPHPPQNSPAAQNNPHPPHNNSPAAHYNPHPPQNNPPHSQYNPHRGPGPLPAASGPVDRVDEPPKKQVTETDLYLLGAIEKLVYRADLMEKRLRRLEESVHYLVAGAEPKPEPCVANFSRVGAFCYHFSPEASDWKTANLQCRKLRSNLLELDTPDERRTMVAAMLADKRIRGMDVWTGGLNPGLLWIWSHSARPLVNNNTSNNNTNNNNNNSGITVVGDGRCLAMVHDPGVNNYVFRGQDCAFRHRYICEKEEDKTRLSNEIQRVSRALKHSARQARLLLQTDDQTSR